MNTEKASAPNADANTSTHLARTLGFWAALSIGVGTMIGAGIFVLPGIVASKAGPGVLLTIPILFITFMGFAEIAAVSEEIHNPSRNLPRSIVGSVVVVTLIYMAVVFCLLALRSYNDPNMAKETVLMEVARDLMGGGGFALILIGGILATVSSANASIMAASRISFAMGRDQLMPEWFNQIHRRFRTPYRSILITGGVTMFVLIIMGGHLELLAEVAGFLSLVLYALITVSSMILRGAKLDWYKPTFQTPGFPLVPLMGLFGCVFVMINTSRTTLIIGYLILAASGAWFVLFLRKGTQLVGTSPILLQQKISVKTYCKKTVFLQMSKSKSARMSPNQLLRYQKNMT